MCILSGGESAVIHDASPLMHVPISGKVSNSLIAECSLIHAVLEVGSMAE